MDSDTIDIEEELPLSVIQTIKCMKSYKFVSYESLCKASIERCEFCERISKNKYSSLVHNAKHIIIPLLKQRVYQCVECYHHFTSQTSLNNHIVIKHDITKRTPQMLLVKTELNNIRVFNPNCNLSIVNHNSKLMSHNTNNSKCDKKIMSHNANNSNCDKKIMSHNTNNLNCDKRIMSHKSNNSNCDKNIMSQIANNSNCDKKILSHNTNKSNCDKKNMNHNTNNSNCDTKIMNYGAQNGYYLNNKSEDTLDIKSRLLFEEDVIESHKLLHGFTAECNVNLGFFKLPPQANSVKQLTYKSISFEELMRPGVFRCKKCSKTFPNRYDTIIHETTHITLRNCQIIKCSICKEYINGAKSELNRHYIDVHASHSQCKKCGALCSDMEKHRMLYCSVDSFSSKVNVVQRSRKLLNLCQLCFSFCKSTHNRLYKCVGSICQLGKRFACNHCGIMSFELLVVERVLRYIEKDRDITRRKQISNESRLKNITTRLKKLKK